ncbi:peptidase S28 [Artomyces pyxidatus]|uniref:Peptidase S28 n=1 Tax=Artomyces pyxidatus TaxID=48021 RepID=A0ACB8TBD9_9AGAM|nr:peptidase S28 [Artomyces pyxidatus]
MLAALSLLLLAPVALAHLTPPRPLPPTIPRLSRALSEPLVHVATGESLPSIDTVYTFDQLIDHTNPSLGTFKQRYWMNWEFYKPGGPIVLNTPGEENAEDYIGYVTNDTIVGQIAQQENGASIVIEHRFFGLSNPYSNLTVASLKYFTIQQSIDDLVHFAQTAKLPMPGGDAVQPGKAPWILVGGSYSGALTAFTMANAPDVFYAGYASSAVVESIIDFWAYFEPIRQFMPANCSADVQAAITYIDGVINSKNATALHALQSSFGMGNVSHVDDFAGSLRIHLWNWQSLAPDSGGAIFYDFCDALEVKNNKSAPASGWGTEYAVKAWGKYWKDTAYSDICGDDDAEDCLGSYDLTDPYYTNVTIDNPDRSWTWLICNEMGFFQDSPPVGKPAIVSRSVVPSGDERQCQAMFPGAFSTPRDPTATATNAAYGGWNMKVDRLFFANGKRDPWRFATVSSDLVSIKSTTTMPIAEGNGFHCTDMIADYGTMDPTVGAVQKAGLANMKTWLASWKPSTPKVDHARRGGRFARMNAL